MELFIYFDPSDYNSKTREAALTLVIYAFYIQFQNYNSDTYKKYENDQITFDNYIKQNFNKRSKFSFLFHYISILISELFIWVILILIFSLIMMSPMTLLFAIELFLFCVVTYKFLNLESNSAFSIWVFVIYSCILTMLIYVYQFTQLEVAKELYMSHVVFYFPEWFKNNMITFGLDIIVESFGQKLLIYFGLNFLSMLLLWEVKRIISNKEELNKKTASKNDEIKNIMEYLRNESELSESVDEKNNDVVLENVNGTAQQNETYIKTLKKNISYYKYYISGFLIVLSKFYWLLIFISLFSIMVEYQLSISMLLYIVIFSFSFVSVFSRQMKMVESFKNKTTAFQISKTIRYSIVEKPNQIESLRSSRKTAFKFLLINGMFFIILTYIYTLFDIVQT